MIHFKSEVNEYGTDEEGNTNGGEERVLPFAKTTNSDERNKVTE